MAKTKSKALLSAEALWDRVGFATDHYADRNNRIDDMIDLYTQNFPKETAELRKSKGLSEPELKQMEVVKPARAARIIHKVISYLGFGGLPSIEVPPLRSGEGREEDKSCSKLEAFLYGVMDITNYQAKRPWFLHNLWWYLIGGLGVLKTIYTPKAEDVEESLPVQICAIDSRKVYPVYADYRLMYVVERGMRYAGDILAELNSFGGRWTTPDILLDEKTAPTTEIEVVEYWDKDQYALWVDGQKVWNKVNPYGFIPYALASCHSTPLADGKWSSNPYLSFTEDAIRQEAYMKSRLSTAVNLSLWKPIAVITPQGQLATLESGPGMVNQFVPGTTISVLDVAPNADIMQNLLGMFVADITANTVPEQLWGQPQYPALSGFAKQMNLMGSENDLALMGVAIGNQLAEALGNILRLAEKKAGTKGWVVFTKEAGKKRHDIVKITSGDVQGHHKVIVQIRPVAQKDKLAEMQFALQSRQPHPISRQPLFSDDYLRREIFRVSDPAQVEIDIEREMIADDPRVQAWEREKAIEEWKRREGITDKKWEEAMVKAGLMQPEAAPTTVGGMGALELPIPPAAGGNGAGMGEGPMMGTPPEMLPPEMAGMGRMDQMSDEEAMQWLASITGRPQGT